MLKLMDELECHHDTALQLAETEAKARESAERIELLLVQLQAATDECLVLQCAMDKVSIHKQELTKELAQVCIHND